MTDNEVTEENRAYRLQVEKAALNKAASPNVLLQNPLSDYTDRVQQKNKRI